MWARKEECPVAVSVYRWERAPGLWSIMAYLEPCFLQDRPRGMVRSAEDREVFGLDSLSKDGG